MAKIKVQDLANELEVKTKDIIDALNLSDVNNADSMLDFANAAGSLVRRGV